MYRHPFLSKEVYIGHLPIGSTHPVRVQSMLNTPTMDTLKCVKQSLQLIGAGCEYVRITAPGMAEAENILQIKNILTQNGHQTPIIADVHFNPKIAEYCARFVEKVRINPGNYADKKSFKKKNYTDSEYISELERIAVRLHPLLDICKENGTAIRIGTNHGSLSDRIINRYGDTPAGMVEATMEFIRICHEYGFSKLVVSLKSSNPVIMIQANRLLVKQMQKENLCYPIHLGVTEAGAGEDGRIKSALGIATLLSEGIGNTIRVSLTEDPVSEIPYAKDIVKTCKTIINFNELADVSPESFFLKEIIAETGLKFPFVIAKTDHTSAALLSKIFKYNNDMHCYERHETSPDALLLNKNTETSNISPYIKIFSDLSLFVKDSKKLKINTSKTKPLLLIIGCKTLTNQWLIETTVILGKLLLSKKIKGVLIDVASQKFSAVINCIFGIFQAAKVRVSKTEYISCPTCGRTSFNLPSTLKRIKKATAHLQGLKIAVMGCVVNGPGEMADADYGYVGSTKGKVNLYKGRQPILKNVPEKEAIDALIKILKQDGVWKEN